MANLRITIDMYSTVQHARVDRVLAPSDVRWGMVLDRLMTRFELDYEEADRAVRYYYQRISMYFPIHWFFKNHLSRIDNEITLAICELTSADSISFQHERRFSAGMIPVGYKHKLVVVPGFRNSDGTVNTGTCSPQIELEIFSRRKSITRPAAAVVIHALLVLSAVLTYLIFVQALLFGMALFIMLLRHPESVAEAITHHFTWGFAVLFFLVGFFGVFGASIRIIWKRLFNRRK